MTSELHIRKQKLLGFALAIGGLDNNSTEDKRVWLRRSVILGRAMRIDGNYSVEECLEQDHRTALIAGLLCKEGLI